MRETLRSESGFSLIELLIAVVILGIGAVSVTAALGTSILSSGVHRGYATAETVTRDYAEAINVKANSQSPYNTCPTAAQLTPSSFSMPKNASNVDLYVVAIEAPPVAKYGSHPAVEYWIPGTTFPQGTFGSATQCTTTLKNNCPESIYGSGSSYKPTASCDPGLQRVWLHVKSNAAALANGTSDAQFVDQYSRILVRRYDGATPS